VEDESGERRMKGGREGGGEGGQGKARTHINDRLLLLLLVQLVH